MHASNPPAAEVQIASVGQTEPAAALDAASPLPTPAATSEVAAPTPAAPLTQFQGRPIRVEFVLLPLAPGMAADARRVLITAGPTKDDGTLDAPYAVVRSARFGEHHAVADEALARVEAQLTMPMPSRPVAPAAKARTVSSAPPVTGARPAPASNGPGLFDQPAVPPSTSRAKAVSQSDGASAATTATSSPANPAAAPAASPTDQPLDPYGVLTYPERDALRLQRGGGRLSDDQKLLAWQANTKLAEARAGALTVSPPTAAQDLPNSEAAVGASPSGQA